MPDKWETDMPEPTVADAMTHRVITVVPDTPFREVVGTMIAYDLDTVAVIDPTGRPLGVITDTDVLAKLEFHGGTDPTPILAGARCRVRRRKSTATTAADLITTPALAITADTSVSTAAYLMADHHRRQLCVIDGHGHLVGMLARLDLLRTLLRGDTAIQADIERDVIGVIHPPHHVTVHVTAGIVTLDGTLRLRSTVEHATHAAHHVPGVIAVHNNLTYDIDDLMITGL
jgi:CBS domain-containing protein